MAADRLFGVLLAAVLIVSGCSGSDDSADGGTGSEDAESPDDPADSVVTDPTGRVGIPAGETPVGLGLCAAVDRPFAGAGGDPASQRVALYGDLAAADPYAGEMLGVFWGPEGEVEHAGDGDRTPVRVRGVDGVAAPITVFQQTVLPEVGTVVAWHEDGLSVGLYGRHWPAARTAELVAVAEALVLADGMFQVPGSALPAGHGLVYQGSAAPLALLSPVTSDYEVQYRTGEGAGDGLVTIHGLEGTAEEFGAFRFLALDLAEADLHGADTITGNAWGESGPAVVTWREPDGRIVRIVGLGVELPVVTELAQFTRQLTPDEWTALEGAATACPAD